MATIYSNRNDSVGAHTAMSPSNTATWAGAVVPATTDQVYVVGRRTTTNMTAFTKWTGTKTITVASTTNFASVGFFYTVTDRSQIVKVNYTSTTSTTFVGCTLDETDPFYVWDDGGSIFNGAYVHNPAYVITINSGETFECDELIIAEGGWLFVNGGTLKINKGIYLRDGRLVGRGNGSIIITRNSQGCSGSYIGYLVTENYQLSVLDIDGGETRTYATTATDAVKGDGCVTIGATSNGSFAVGDNVAVYKENDYRRRNKGYTGYRDASASFKNMDEGFDVCGVNGNVIYLALLNGAKGTVKEVETADTQKILNVKYNSMLFVAGDKVVINNNIYTIDKVEDSEYLRYSYDFTNPATSLSDFWVDDSTHIYSGSWSIESGVGLKNTSGGYRELTHKYCWERDVIIEAEMSPLSAYYSGTRGTAQFGIHTSYDPSFRWGHRGDDSFKTDIFRVNDASDYIAFWIRSMSNYANNRLSRDTALRDTTRKACTYRIENRKGKTKILINGSELTTEFRRDGAYKGLVGLYTNDTNFRCKSLKIKSPTQKLYITTADNILAGSIIYQTGMECDHPTGSKIVKLASINSGTGNHKDLAFAYRGQNGNGEFPLIEQLNGTNTTNNSFPYLHNHDMNIDYYCDLGNSTSEKSITIDLIEPKTFSHVSFVPRIQDYSTYYGFNGVTVYGSNDKTNWTTLYGATNDTKKWYYGSYNRMAFYPTGTVTYRYVKFATKGAQHATYFTNRYVNIGVHNFTDGYILSCNNASDFNVGDKITMLTDTGYSWGSREVEAYYAWVSNNASDPETFWHGGWLPECTVIAKNENSLSLDRPIFWGYVEGEDSVTIVKTNKNFTICGTMGSTSSSNDWRWPNITFNSGSSNGRVHLLKNTRFDYIGSYRYSSSGYDNRGLINRCYDYWNAVNFDGCVHMMGQDGVPQGGVLASSGHTIYRNSVSIGGYIGYASYYSTSYTGSAYFNNKILNCYNAIYVTQIKAFAAKYNEISTTDMGFRWTDSRVDRSIIPFQPEISRNYVNGVANTAYYLNCESWGSVRGVTPKFEYNKARGGDDYAMTGCTHGGILLKGCDFLSEHTGCRMSRYRNEGFIGQGDNTSDLTPQNLLKDFNRYGYDLIHGVYSIYERNPDWPGVLRVYNPNGDASLSMLGMEIEVLEDNVPFQVFVKFDYRYPQLARLQDDGNLDGQLRCFSLQHGTWLKDVTGVAPSTAGTGWNTFTATFDTFASQEGRAAVYLNRAAQNSYVEFRNGTAYVLTDYPDKIRVLGNSFRLSNIWDSYEDIANMKPLSLANRAVKFTNVKF